MSGFTTFIKGLCKWYTLAIPLTCGKGINIHLNFEKVALSLWISLLNTFKGVYWDGHERKDVRACQTKYLKEMEELEILVFIDPSYGT